MFLGVPLILPLYLKLVDTVHGAPVYPSAAKAVDAERLPTELYGPRYVVGSPRAHAYPAASLTEGANKCADIYSNCVKENDNANANEKIGKSCVKLQTECFEKLKLDADRTKPARKPSGSAPRIPGDLLEIQYPTKEKEVGLGAATPKPFAVDTIPETPATKGAPKVSEMGTPMKMPATLEAYPKPKSTKSFSGISTKKPTSPPVGTRAALLDEIKSGAQKMREKRERKNQLAGNPTPKLSKMDTLKNLPAMETNPEIKSSDFASRLAAKPPTDRRAGDYSLRS
jgi:hypothetical protein